jgi:L-ascorbate metabolism protein UlaG (beta-lactamase superfamily)
MVRNTCLKALAIALVLSVVLPVSAADFIIGAGNLAEVLARSTPACMGGPNLDAGDYAAFRWLGNACWEINYRGQIVLIDNFYDRGPRAPVSGVTASAVKKADCIIISHGHKDHISDTAQVAKQTGAPVYAHSTVITRLREAGVPEGQLHAFVDKETEKIPFGFNGFTITMIHTIHNSGGKDASGFRTAIATYTSPTKATLDEETAISARGSSDKTIGPEGLFSFLITFDTGFKFFGTESNAMGLAPGMQTFVDNLKKNNDHVDILAAPMQLGYDPIADLAYKKVLDIIQDTRPRLILPQHHDVYPDFPMTSVLPLAQYVADNMSTTTNFKLQLYREPLCFNVKTQVGIGPLSPLPRN